MIRRYLPRSTEEMIRWYEKYLSPFALLGGFLLDNFVFLDRIDSLQSYVLLSAYMIVAAVGIVCIHVVETGRVRHASILAAAPILPVVIQFAFGGLFSGFLAVYWRSASVAVSWIFVIGLAALLIGNERFRTQYVKLPFQIGVFFIVLFSFFIFFLPIIFQRIGSLMFVFSGVATIAVTALLLYALRFVVPDVWKRERTRVTRVVVGAYLVFNVLYFTNAIPPLPLALKEAGVYHSVVRDGDAYILTAEPVPWYKRYLAYNTEYHRVLGEPVYVFSAIYASKGLQTGVMHEWQRKDEQGNWITESTIPFTISGGREEGYRAYSSKSALSEGRWRVNVLTKNRQVIGRVSFTVIHASSTPELVEITR